MVSLPENKRQGEAPMRVDLAFTPAGLVPRGRVCIVIDVLRFSSALVTMFARGLDVAIVASSLEEARRLSRQNNGLLCGERGGRPPTGFDFGNSPAEFQELDFSGKRAVLYTTNGTRAIARAARADALFVGALLNLRAVAQLASDEAHNRGATLTLVCAGEDRGTAFSLEDAYCAGAFVNAVAQWSELTDGAAAGLRIFHSFRGSADQALRQSAHGRALINLGSETDVELCARTDVFDAVPRLAGQIDGAWMLRAR
jgi:2-phosphosulfolactate phosphatase